MQRSSNRSSSRLLVVFSLLLPALGAAEPFSALATPGAVIGQLEGVVLEGDQYFVTGWTCQQGVAASLGIHVYAGASAYDEPRGQFMFSGVSRFMAEPAVSERCGAGSGRYRFHVAIPEHVLAAVGGQTLYVHGLRAIDGVQNSALVNSGKIRFPRPLSDAPRGCMSSLWADTAERNAYPSGNAQGQGQPWVYMAWVWRETPAVETNHSVSVARSQDLVNWYNTCGEKLPLPLTTASRAVVDPLQTHQGVLNNVNVGFDGEGRPVVTYQKYKAVYSENQPPVWTTQVYNARLEGSQWTIHEMTAWRTQHVLLGGGSLPRTPFSVSYSVPRVTNTGAVVQSFSRADADTTGTPTSGNWTLSAAGTQLVVTTAPGASIDYDTFTQPVPGLPAEAREKETRETGWATPFTLRLMRPRVQKDAIVIRGNWDGDGNRAGLFLTKTRTFVIQRRDGTSRFNFGPATTPFLPLVGDWDQDGLSTIGIVDPVTERYYLRNLLAGGTADASGTGGIASLGATDGPLRWDSQDPALTYYLRWESMPTNRDLPYDCSGHALSAYQPTETTCPEKFLTELVVWRYDPTAQAWRSSRVDRAWGGSSASFDFVVFKRHQIVAYYDANRRVKVAIRNGEGPWTYVVLDDQFRGWDSHNYLTLEVDDNHDIHLSGDLHGHPLTYWRSRGLVTSTFARQPMVGTLETRATYPRFYRSPQGDFLFKYRQGSSGDGEWIINRYDVRTYRWSRLLDQPLFGR
ncbi:BNR-4 repeat-containing protein [Hyalangium gracile]|uniref:BNR-4 repeat-containing protein n=1 Tax=Hyalangium gracile TaxID=394092 RepID=UPI001CCFD942|nr:BNR-4 repeat-containing protein [Hyalangium gracile]